MQLGILSKPTKTFTNFPVDKYVPACIISYQVANLPPNKFSTSKEPVPSVRFLFAGRAKDEQGELVVVRKWTRWFTISYGPKAKLCEFFKGIKNVQALLSDDGDNGELWTTQFKIMLESTDDGVYTNIMKAKIDDDNDSENMLDIVYTGTITLPDGTETFAPYKMVNAYGKPVFLDFAVNKEKDGIKLYEANDFVDNVGLS